MIEIKNISKSFDGTKVLDDISCTVNDGTILGIVGSNGAGKSTMLRMMTGVYDISQGEVFYDGQALNNKFENTPDVLFISDEVHYEISETIDAMAKRYKLFYKNFDYDKFEKLLSLFDLDKKKKMDRLSKGMKKQAIISIALACNAKYLLLDETLDGLDPLMRINVKKLIYDETVNRKMITVITSHSLKELEDMCDSLSMLHQGKIVLNGSIDSLKEGLVKVRCAFNEDAKERDFDMLELHSFEDSGKICTLIAVGQKDEIKEKIGKLNPLLVEVLPITIEEIFIIKLKKLGYGNQLEWRVDK